MVLNRVMNASGPVYRQGTYIQGDDTNNGIFTRILCLGLSATSKSLLPCETHQSVYTRISSHGRYTPDLCSSSESKAVVVPMSNNEQVKWMHPEPVTDALPSGSDFIVW